MAEKKDVQSVTKDGAVKDGVTFSGRDQKYIAEMIVAKYEDRKGSKQRKDREKHWAEVDRQIAMDPDIAFKQIPGNDSKVDPEKAWMSEMEVPLQAEALEVLTSDCQELLFPDSGMPFVAHAETPDGFLDGLDALPSIIAGDDTDVPSLINQDNVDHYCAAYVAFLLRQGDFQERVNRINAETMKYGMGVGRVRMQTKSIWMDTARGVMKTSRKIPVLHPTSIKNTYLEEPSFSTHTSQELGCANITEDWMSLENLHLAAHKGSTDYKNPDGGWIPKNLKGIESDENGRVHILEMEGDFVVPRKTTDALVFRNYIATVAMNKSSKNDKDRCALIRLRKNKYPFSNFVLFPYQYEGAYDTYPSSPLLKGRTIQIMAVEALNRLLDSAALKNSPPVSYDRNDPGFAGSGGPVIAPYAKWEANGEIKVHSEVGGDTEQLQRALSLALKMYAELTGVLPTRLGEQTVSHTTAFAKEAELSRGASRTVAYVDRIGKGPMPRFLEMVYQMGRDNYGSQPETFYSEAYQGWLSPTKDHLPERCMFTWFGAGGPAEQQALMRSRAESLEMAVQLWQLGTQSGQNVNLDIQQAINQTLREGKWSDVDAITGGSGANQPDQGAQGIQGPDQGNPGVAATALQALAFGGQ